MPLRIAAVLLFTAVCLLVVLWGLDFSVVGASLAAAEWSTLLPVIALYGVTHCMRVARMQALLDRPVSFRRVFSILSIGYLAIHVVPFRMGELVRPYLLAEREGVPFASGLAVILVERLLDMLMLLLMLLTVATFLDLPEAVVVGGVDVIAATQKLMAAGVIVGSVGLATILFLGERALKLTDRLPVGGLVRKLHAGFAAVPRDPLRVAWLLTLSAAVWLVTIFAVMLALTMFPGLPSSFGEAFTIWTIALAGMTAVPTPGFFGSFEASASAAIVMFGTPLDVARTFSVILHLSQFAFTVSLGIGCLLWEGLSLREVVGRSREKGVAV